MALATIGGQPVLILKEGTSRTKGEEARRINFMAAKAVADAVRSTLGPKGMDKMIIDQLGDITISNDGAAILDEMDVQHPAAKLMVNLAKGQDQDAGDGTTTSVILAGEFISQSEMLLDQGMHPTIIADGFKKALEKTKEIMDKIAISVTPEDEGILKKAILTAMYSKLVREEGDYLADLVIKAAKQIMEEHDGKRRVAIDKIKIIKKQGKSLGESQLINGIVLDKEIVHSGMPRRIENAKIALLNCPLEIEKTEYSAEIRITDPSQIKSFMEEETRILEEMVDKIASTGANVVFCQKGIDEVAQHLLARRGILAARRISEKDMSKLQKATKARIITNIEDITPEDLGKAGLVEERRVGEDKMIFVENCEDPKAVTLLLRAGTEMITEEVERSIHDALCVARNILEDGKAVYGGGAVEVEIARRLRDYAEEVGGKEQKAIEAYADALEGIPSALAENAGLDVIDILMKLRSEHAKGKETYGIDVMNGGLEDMKKLGIIETYRATKHAIEAATEVALMLIRTDDIIAAKPYEKPKGKEGEETGEGGGLGGESLPE